MELRMTRRMKTYEDTDRRRHRRGHRERARAHGRRRRADGPTYDVVQQLNQSDLAFLRERARLIQAEVWVDDDTLSFKTRGKPDGPDADARPGQRLLAVAAARRPGPPAHEGQVSGYDAQAATTIDEEAGADAIQAEITGGRTGPPSLERALGERVSHRVREAPLVGGEAHGLGQGRDAAPRARFVTVVGDDRGHARHGRRQPVDAGARRRAVRRRRLLRHAGLPHLRPHATGFRTHFEAERATRRTRATAMIAASTPPTATAPRYFGVYPAIVTDIVDPRPPRPDRGQVPLARRRRRRDVRAWATLCTPVRRRRPGASRSCRRSTRRWSSRSRPATCGGRTSSARAGTAGRRCPQSPEQPNNKRLLKTRPGSMLEFDDTDGAEKVTLSMRAGPQAACSTTRRRRSRVTHSNGCVDHAQRRRARSRSRPTRRSRSRRPS